MINAGTSHRLTVAGQVDGKESRWHCMLSSGRVTPRSGDCRRTKQYSANVPPEAVFYVDVSVDIYLSLLFPGEVHREHNIFPCTTCKVCAV